MNETLMSNGEIGGALVAFAQAQGRIPKDAVITDVRLVVLGLGNQCHASIEWRPAPQRNESPEEPK